MDESWKIYKSRAKIIESWSRWWSALGSFGLLCVKWCAVYTLRLKGTFAFLQCFWYADWGILHLIFSSPFSQFIIWIWMVKSIFWCCWRKKSCTTWDILTLQLMGRATTLNWLTGFLNHQQYGILIRWLYQPLRNDKVDEFISPLIWMMKRPFFLIWILQELCIKLMWKAFESIRAGDNVPISSDAWLGISGAAPRIIFQSALVGDILVPRRVLDVR